VREVEKVKEMSDEASKVATFIGTTDADESFARSFLAANDWNLQNAINMFFESGGVAGAAASTQAPSKSSSSSSSSSSFTADSSRAAEVSKIVREMGVSEADARAILAAQGGPSQGEDAVRAPIAPVQGRLFDPSPFGGAAGGLLGTPNTMVSSMRDLEQESRQLEALQREQRQKRQKESIGTSALASGDIARSKASALAPSYDRDNENSYSGDEEMAESNALPSARDKNLQTLFQPPREMLFVGTFEEARNTAKGERKFVLVNIQKDSEFFSYVLNRDLWQDEIVRDILIGSFVFFQHEHSDHDAQNYIRLYNPVTFPHIAAIDPRTGEQLAVFDLRTRAAEKDPDDLRCSFMDKISSFLDKNNFEGPQASTPPPSQKPRRDDEATYDPSTAPGTPATPSISPAPAPVPGAGFVPEVNAGADASSQVLGTRTTASAPTSETQSAARPVVVYPQLNDEPASGEPDTTQVRVRLFDGKTMTRRFRTTDKVAQLFSLVRSQVPETETREFDIVVNGMPPRSLADSMDATLAEQALTRVQVSVKWTN